MEGKRKGKTKHLNDVSKEPKKVVGPRAKKGKEVQGGTKKEGKDVLRDIQEEGVLSRTKSLRTFESWENDDDLDEYILDLDKDNEFRNECWHADKLPSTSKDSLMNPLGEMFRPYNIRHPRSADCWPMDHMAQFIKKWIKIPLDKEVRSVLRVACSRSVIEGKACLIPNLYSELLTFLFLMGRDPRKGLEHSLKQGQDKLLDVVGPLARILDMAEEGHINECPVDLELLSGWSEKANANANAGLSAEKRRVILFKINPKLGT
ncbi:hypothetical protein NDU88_002858 [Pleurodeles waltl]|uniref:Uncharacterized protein n=1 Tax=Pleurodeles waltl TaxID=8319 RepID=A0AAV7TME9_PLEWA|nr:hypothetical protein NDU88_002858 [Pleurodeles waltl]